MSGPDNADERWITIPKWDEFQHPDTLRAKGAPWIKLYTRLIHKDEYLDLSLAQRGLLHDLWVAMAISGSRPLRMGRAKAMLGLSAADAKHWRRHIEALAHAGLIELHASKALAQCKQDASTRKEVIESKREDARAKDFNNNGHPTCPHCGIRRPTQTMLLDHLANVHGQEPT